MQQETNIKALLHVAEQMVLAASTAPKGRGEDNLEIAILEREDILKAAEEMERIGQAHGTAAFCATRATCATMSISRCSLHAHQAIRLKVLRTLRV